MCGDISLNLANSNFLRISIAIKTSASNKSICNLFNLFNLYKSIYKVTLHFLIELSIIVSTFRANSSLRNATRTWCRCTVAISLAAWTPATCRYSSTRTSAVPTWASDELRKRCSSPCSTWRAVRPLTWTTRSFSTDVSSPTIPLGWRYHFSLVPIH